MKTRGTTTIYFEVGEFHTFILCYSSITIYERKRTHRRGEFRVSLIWKTRKPTFKKVNRAHNPHRHSQTMNFNSKYLRHLAIQKNNDAVRHIASGENALAIQNLTFALNECKLVMESEMQLKTQQENLTLDQCMEYSEEIHEPENARGKDFDIYGQGIYIPLELSLDSNSNVMISAMIIFNLALAQQLLDSKPDSKCIKLVQAAKLYDLVFHLQRDGRLRDNVYFMLATVNNLGVAYEQLGNTEAASACFERLLSTLMLMLDCGETTPRFGRFLRNATSTMSQKASAPAA